MRFAVTWPYGEPNSTRERKTFPMAHVIEINNIENLEPYRLAWNALLPGTPNASFFHTYDWLEAYWRHFGAEQKLRVLVVLSCGKPIGIVPLCVRRDRYRVGALRVLTYPLDDWGTWFGPIGANTAATTLMAMRHLRESPHDWDMLEFRWNDGARSDRARTFRAMRAVGFQPRQTVHQEISLVDTGGGWDAYWASRQAKWRNNVRRAERRLRSAGTIEFVRFRPEGANRGDGEPAWHLYNACCDIAAKSWQGRLGENTTLTSERVSAFLREAHAIAARLGMVDLNLLYVGGKPAAFTYNYWYDGRIHGLRAGYDQAVSDAGSGGVLITRSIEDSFQRGDESLDLGTGWSEYKRRIRTDVAISHRITHYRRLAMRSQGVRMTRWIKTRFAAHAADAIESKKSTAATR